MTYASTAEWVKWKKRRIAKQYDDQTLFTGLEGSGKSTLAMKVLSQLDPRFNIDRVHFELDSFLDQYVTLKPGDAILLDEFQGHRRESMRGHRMEYLDHIKEVRALRIHAGVVFNRFTNLDRDLITDRINDWVQIDIPRALFTLRHPKSRVIFDRMGEPHDRTVYPIGGRFPFTADLDPELKAAYDAKKLARMRDRAARRRNDEPKATPAPEMPVIDSLAWESILARRNMKRTHA